MKSLQNSKQNIGKSDCAGDLSITMNALIKDYLFRVYMKEIKSEYIKVVKMLGIGNYAHPYVTLPTVNFSKETGLYKFSDFLLLCSVEYLNNSYEVCLKRTLRQASNGPEIFEYDSIFINGISKNASRSVDLKNQIGKEAVSNSNMKGKVLKVKDVNMITMDILPLCKIVEIPNTKLEDIFIQENKKEQIKRFIHSVNNFDNESVPLRYLFSGKPGTGKTKIINSIINEIKEKATVLILNSGGKIMFSEAVDFCNLFNSSVIILDDLDFLAGDRNENMETSNLSSFLQYLDGLLNSNIFILAATNDKTLVDKAASRPGRFDMILDIGEIDFNNYLSLVKRETEDERILRYFNDDLLSSFKDKNVTGAFLVSLVKQLASALKIKDDLTPSDFNNYLELSHKGFYSRNDENYSKVIGFNN